MAVDPPAAMPGFGNDLSAGTILAVKKGHAHLGSELRRTPEAGQRIAGGSGAAIRRYRDVSDSGVTSGRILSTRGVERALRNVDLGRCEPVFVGVPDVTADALEYLDSLNVRLLRESTYRVVVRTDEDMATN